MKLLSILLISYLFLLCAFPCADDCSASTPDCLSSQHSDHSASSSNDQEKCHTCSPFCFCNCCHVNSIPAVTVSYQVLQTVYTEQNVVYIERKIDLFHAPVWHPPQNIG